MYSLKKSILVDESQEPIAVQIDYRDWLKIERALPGHDDDAETPKDLASLHGSIWLDEDPLDIQNRIRTTNDWLGFLK